MASSAFDKEALMNQAQHIWTMLDEMAASDPASYKNFVDKHIKEGKESLKPPEPHMCVSTHIKVPVKQKLYVNFFSWQKIPEPKSADDPLPVMGSKITQENINNEKCQVVSVAFNPKVLEEYGRHAKNSLDKDTLINLAFDYVEKLNNVVCSRNYDVLKKDQMFMGCLKNLQNSFTQSTSKADESIEELSKTFAPLVAGTANGGLMEQLTNIASVHDKSSVSHSKSKEDIHLSEPKTNKSTLIEEIKSEKTVQKIACNNTDKTAITHLDNSSSTNDLEIPKYEIEKSWNDRLEGQCTIRIYLPNVSSVSECELDISEDELCLLVPLKYHLNITLVNKVNDEKSEAKFIKKTHCLQITMPLIKN